MKRHLILLASFAVVGLLALGTTAVFADSEGSGGDDRPSSCTNARGGDD